MEIRYFDDTDTLDIAFKRLGRVHRTVDGPSEDILLDFDEEGQLIGLTIEHASRNVPLEELLAERDRAASSAGWLGWLRRAFGPSRRPGHYEPA
mgnify:CR=1 FL=1